MALKDTYGVWAKYFPSPQARAWEAFLDAIDAIAAGALPYNIDGGNADDVYTPEQQIDGGESGSIFTAGQVIDGGTA